MSNVQHTDFGALVHDLYALSESHPHVLNTSHRDAWSPANRVQSTKKLTQLGLDLKAAKEKFQVSFRADPTTFPMSDFLAFSTVWVRLSASFDTQSQTINFLV